MYIYLYVCCIYVDTYIPYIPQILDSSVLRYLGWFYNLAIVLRIAMNRGIDVSF